MNSGVRNYILVTAAYWGFTLTDGALRMLVLLHFYGLGYSPFQIAQLFLFYEVFGIVTNLVGGWIGARLGLKVTLFAGLGLQVVALAALSRFNSDWPIVMGVAYVMGSQALSGIAKDLTKLSAKSAIKVLVTDGNHGALFKWVAALTGSKNALKGLGFFLGGFLLSWLGFSVALITMAACLGAILLAAVVSLPGNIGQTKAKVRFGDVFSKSAKINWLSGARFFLFGARDIWFVVGLPLFLAGSLGWDHPQVGAYMALWVIAYGLVQAATPKLLRQSGAAPTGGQSRRWLLGLILVTSGIALMLWANIAPGLSVLVGMLVFGFVFAVNSAIHSYLILAYSKSEHTSMDVGFYYMANAGGRLAGTLLSGLAYQWGGLVVCLGLSATFLCAAWLFSLPLPKQPDPAAKTVP
ncbi:MAG: organoarsenical effux MFS transporter ArsJ [Rhodospirillaceae bacterium]|jgi:hypothetical protein|nr:organoarsenical effux MFS transporter ArsJ [Rhodospirillaceae bacterium]MBT4043110.1 organoarsenical effux MFS transporter ArsJ [Rhodospirillaceae bacterium]MBT4688108.1 organoarsenical effux MFS transporter ArsJ [Rhodospirillaceae bacterium]MBT5080275.1 organoarsenical effux MFS transporter ArsJ [Rhodospirillaceae bacterium]MBT5525026.1 organoarsenical effux MFS transporter ArsJ [Rhodospirillaceae bacterium]